MKNDYGMKMNIFTTASLKWLICMLCVCCERHRRYFETRRFMYPECPVLLWKYDWKYRKRRKTNEKKLNHRQQQKQNIYHCGLDLQNSFFVVLLVFSFWWFRLSKLELDAIFTSLKIDLGCQPKQSYLIARIHIIHLSRSRAFISIILILNTRKYSFKITLYHWPCFSFPIRGPQCQLKVPIQLPPEQVLFFLSEN